MKDKILSEEGHRQQLKLKELQAVAERLGCTLPQLAIGKTKLQFVTLCLRPSCPAMKLSMFFSTGIRFLSVMITCY